MGQRGLEWLMGTLSAVALEFLLGLPTLVLLAVLAVVCRRPGRLAPTVQPAPAHPLRELARHASCRLHVTELLRLGSRRLRCSRGGRLVWARTTSYCERHANGQHQEGKSPGRRTCSASLWRSIACTSKWSPVEIRRLSSCPHPRPQTQPGGRSTPGGSQRLARTGRAEARSAREERIHRTQPTRRARSRSRSCRRRLPRPLLPLPPPPRLLVLVAVDIGAILVRIGLVNIGFRLGLRRGRRGPASCGGVIVIVGRRRGRRVAPEIQGRHLVLPWGCSTFARHLQQPFAPLFLVPRFTPLPLRQWEGCGGGFRAQAQRLGVVASSRGREQQGRRGAGGGVPASMRRPSSACPF